MKGDFSNWYYEMKENFNGVLHQQGKVLLDRDWNDEIMFKTNWQHQLGKDVIGHDVAAVSAHEYNNFRIQKISNIYETEKGVKVINLQITPGRLWVDGSLIYLKQKLNAEDAASVIDEPKIIKRIATPLEFIDVERAQGIAATKIMVFLEVWQDVINGFQEPKLLIEPALNGIDTTERLQTMFSFKYLEIDSDAINCSNFHEYIKYSEKGRLSASFRADVEIDEECPKLVSGGYTGLEHRFYRIEMAKTNLKEGPFFKWDRNNGSLVGRGIFNITEEEKVVEIKANLQPILYSDYLGSETGADFYMEIVDYNEELGMYEPLYGAKVKLMERKMLKVEKDEEYLDLRKLANKEQIFFRLWKGIKSVSDYTLNGKLTNKNKLESGICLAFDRDNKKSYRPGDFWTFPVRADAITLDGKESKKEIFVLKEPFGINYRLIPLAIKDNDDIKDCRIPFRPLVSQKNCSFYTVGDGSTSYGDFDNIDEAFRRLPKKGGEIRILPGNHEINLEIDRSNITISGCGERTKISNKPGDNQPIFSIRNSKNIILRNMNLSHLEKVNAINIIESEAIAISNNIISVNRGGIQITNNSKKIAITNNIIQGGTGSAIILGNGIQIQNLQNLLDEYNDNIDLFQSLSSHFPTLSDVMIENNQISNMGESGISTSNLFEYSPTDSDRIAILKDNQNELQHAFELFFQNAQEVSPSQYWIKNLYICKNKINNYFQEFDNLNNENVIKFDFKIRGLGGISLISCKNLIVQNNKINEEGIYPVCGISVKYGEEIKIFDNSINFSSDQNPSDLNIYKYSKGIYVKARNCYIEENNVNVNNMNINQGGIQILGGSERMIIMNNSIKGGDGPGITLGNGIPIKRVIELRKNENSKISSNLEDLEKFLSPFFTYLSDIRIENNDISNMGASGISSANFFTFEPFDNSFSDNDENIIKNNILPIIKPFFQLGNVIVNLNINNNIIQDCLKNFNVMCKLPIPILGFHLELELNEEFRNRGLGGITLLSCLNLIINNNKIMDFGMWPTCGIYIKYGENIDISNNKIINNIGYEIDKILAKEFWLYNSGGIIIELALSDSILSELKGFQEFPIQDEPIPLSAPLFNRYAARIHGNVVHPHYGHSLILFAIGPVSVLNNSFKTPIATAPIDYHTQPPFKIEYGIIEKMEIDKFPENWSECGPEGSVTVISKHEKRDNVLYLNGSTELSPKREFDLQPNGTIELWIYFKEDTSYSEIKILNNNEGEVVVIGVSNNEWYYYDGGSTQYTDLPVLEQWYRVCIDFSIDGTYKGLSANTFKFKIFNTDGSLYYDSPYAAYVERGAAKFISFYTLNKECWVDDICLWYQKPFPSRNLIELPDKDIIKNIRSSCGAVFILNFGGFNNFLEIQTLSRPSSICPATTYQIE
ncbi:MAG: DUF6519 domain-containing protein, partial [Candidatus Thorarchaeota archaeon]